jgi:hypothetical protein
MAEKSKKASFAQELLYEKLIQSIRLQDKLSARSELASESMFLECEGFKPALSQLLPIIKFA